MTLQQEAYKRIDHMSDDGIRFFLNMVDSLQTMSNRDFMMRVEYDPERETITPKDSPNPLMEKESEEIAKSRNILLLSEIDRFQSLGDEDYVSEKVIDNVVNIVFHLKHQPEIFKTQRNSLHLQFEMQDKSYMEFEVFEDRITCMIVPQRKYEKAIFPEVSLNNSMRLNQVVEEFYSAE